VGQPLDTANRQIMRQPLEVATLPRLCCTAARDFYPDYNRKSYDNVLEDVSLGIITGALLNVFGLLFLNLNYYGLSQPVLLLSNHLKHQVHPLRVINVLF